MLGTMMAPGRSAGSNPPARPKLISAEAPADMSEHAAACAPAVVPPPTATGKPSRCTMRASATRPTTTAARPALLMVCQAFAVAPRCLSKLAPGR